MAKTDVFERYLIEEFYDDYQEGSLDRGAFTRRVAFIRGSMAAAVAMAAVGCAPDELPAATEPMPTATLAPPPAADRSIAADSGSAGRTPPSQPAASADTGQSPFSVPIDDPAIVAEDVIFNSGADEIAGHLAHPAAGGPHPAILVCHENRGLVEHIRDVARCFAKAGYVALAIDLLWREGGTAVFDRDAVPGMLTGAGADRHLADFQAGFEFLQARDDVEPDRIGMTGYCFGGGITWRFAAANPDLKAAVPFYGIGPDLDEVPNIKAAVLGVYAEQDSRVNAGKDALEQALPRPASSTRSTSIPASGTHSTTTPVLDTMRSRPPGPGRTPSPGSSATSRTPGMVTENTVTTYSTTGVAVRRDFPVGPRLGFRFRSVKPNTCRERASA
jgi:carboxymethylenebutenolidase